MKNNTDLTQVSSFEIDLIELLLLLKKNILLIIMLILLLSSISFVYTKYFIKPQYTASISLYIANNQTTQEKIAIQVKDIDASQKLADTYEVILNDNIVMREIAVKLIEEYGIDYLKDVFPVFYDENPNGMILPNDIKSVITMNVVNDTEILKITATTIDPKVSAAICTDMSEIAPVILSRVMGKAYVEPIGYTKIPTEQSSPNIKLNILIGAFIGFLISIFIIIVKYMLNQTITNIDALQQRIDLPILCEIPFYEAIKTNMSEKQNKSVININTVLDTENFSVIESYKRFRTNLLFALSAQNAKKLIFSSSFSGEGKSLTSANTAITIAQTGSKVILLDCDLRNPMQQKIFKLDNNKGISTIICKMSSVNNSIHHNVQQNLDILSSGPIPPNPSEMLASENMCELLKELEKNYDYIIIDTPPISIVTDALLLSKLSSDIGIALIARYGTTTYEHLKKTINNCEFVEINLLGVILNAVGENKKAYKKYYKQYPYYYN